MLLLCYYYSITFVFFPSFFFFSHCCVTSRYTVYIFFYRIFCFVYVFVLGFDFKNFQTFCCCCRPFCLFLCVFLFFFWLWPCGVLGFPLFHVFFFSPFPWPSPQYMNQLGWVVGGKRDACPNFPCRRKGKGFASWRMTWTFFFFFFFSPPSLSLSLSLWKFVFVCLRFAVVFGFCLVCLKPSWLFSLCLCLSLCLFFFVYV